MAILALGFALGHAAVARTNFYYREVASALNLNLGVLRLARFHCKRIKIVRYPGAGADEV